MRVGLNVFGYSWNRKLSNRSDLLWGIHYLLTTGFNFWWIRKAIGNNKNKKI